MPFYLEFNKALNRILSVFTGHMNCIGKKSKLNAPRKLIFTSFYNKFVTVLLTLTQKCHISQISNVQKVRHLEQPSPGGLRTEQSRREIQCK